MLYSTVSIIIAKWANLSRLKFCQLEGEAAISLQASLYPTARRMKTCKWRSSHTPASAAFYNLLMHNICRHKHTIQIHPTYTLSHLTEQVILPYSKYHPKCYISLHEGVETILVSWCTHLDGIWEQVSRLLLSNRLNGFKWNSELWDKDMN